MAKANLTESESENEVMSQLILLTGAYQDLDKPVILAGGELGIYYVNTEKLVQDNGKFNEFGNSSYDMINHAIEMTKQHPSFKEAIDIISNRAMKLFIENEKRDYTKVISGGQRRDWLFSGPVADKLQVPHISLYKQGVHDENDKIEVVMPDGNHETKDLHNVYAIHIVDLITEASSVYRKENEMTMGWAPMLRNRHIKIDNLISVVSRNQGGEERLRGIGIEANSFVTINENFIRKYSKNPERGLDYLQDPEMWSTNYLIENGASEFFKTFNPEGGKLDRAKRFISRYKDVLDSTGRMKELDSVVKQNYGKSLQEILN